MNTEKATHTPGPWEVEKGYETHADPIQIWAGRGGNVQRIAKVGGHGGIAEPANARLIAAAPELYHSLACIIAYVDAGQIVERDGMRPLKDSHAISTARAALAKAKP